MEVHLTPDVETQLRRLAANRGMDASAIPRGFLSWTVETLNEAVDEWVMALPEDMRARIALRRLIICFAPRTATKPTIK